MTLDAEPRSVMCTKANARVVSLVVRRELLDTDSSGQRPQAKSDCWMNERRASHGSGRNGTIW